MIRTWADTAVDLDLEISRTTNHPQLFELSKRRNAVTPFYRLPNETLERILLTIQTSKGISRNENQISVYESLFRFSDYKPEYTGSFWVTANLEWVHAMLVCRRLREVALASTSLWAHVNMNHKSRDWVDLCLQRAGSHFLRLDTYLRAPNEDTSARLDDLFSRSHAIRLRLYVDHVLDEEELADNTQIISALGSIRDKLRICSANTHLSFLEIFSEFESFPLSNALLGGESNNLTHLLLQELVLDPLDVAHMPLLRRLVLQRVVNDLHCRQLRSFLSQTPNLEELYMMDLYDDSREMGDFTVTVPDIDDDPPIRLAHLATLHVGGELIQISQTLQSCLPPSDRTSEIDLRVEIRYLGYEIVDNPDPLTSLTQVKILARRVHARVAQNLSTLSSDMNVSSCSIQVSELSDELKDITLELGTWGSAYEPYCAFTRLLCPIGDDLTNLICSAKRVTVTLSQGGSLSTFIPDICAVAELQVLVLTEVALHTPDRHDPSPDSEVARTAHEEQLERLLSQRRQRYNAPIQRLVLSNYTYLELESDEQEMFMTIPLPSMTAREAFEKKWRSAGWVNVVEWVHEEASLLMRA